MTNTTKAHIGLLLSAMIYGVSFVVAKEIMSGNYIQPFGLILLRVIAALTLFILINPMFTKEKVDKKDYKHMFVGGILGVAVNMLCFFKGLDMTTPIHAALIMTTTPILVYIIAIAIGQESLNIKKVGGIILGAAGAVLLISQGYESGSYARNTVMGDILILINALSFGLYLVYIKKMTKKYHPTTVIKWVFSFGLLMVFPFGIKELLAVDWSTFDTNIWLALGFILLFTSFLTYLFSILGLKYISSSSVSGYIYMQPFIASFVAIITLKEQITSVKIIAGILIFLGVFLIILNKSKKE